MFLKNKYFGFFGLGSKSTLINIPLKKPKTTYQLKANQPEKKMIP